MPKKKPNHPNIPELLSLMDQSCIRSSEEGLGEALRLDVFLFDIEFLLMGISRSEGNGLWELLQTIQLDPAEFRGALRGSVSFEAQDWRNKKDVRALGAKALPELQEATEEMTAGKIQPKSPVIAARLLAVLEHAAQMAGDEKVTPNHLLLAVMQVPNCAPVKLLNEIMLSAGYEPEKFIERLLYLSGVQSEVVKIKDNHSKSAIPPLKENGLLSKLGRDLTALALAGKLSPALGEHARKAMLQMGLILQQTQSNNPVLLGDSGVGKTAIVEGFAYRLALDPQVLPELSNKRIVDISATSVLAGVDGRGELEERIRQLIKEVREAKGQVILFIDELHTFLRDEGVGEILANALKPALARGEFPLIGATTVEEYRRYIEGDAALARRFTPVWVEEPSAEDAIKIARGVVDARLSPHHQVEYPDEVIAEAVHLSMRYIHDEFLPGKAIKILDQAGPHLMMGGSLRGADLSGKRPKSGVVTVETIRAIISARTGIPLTQLSQNDMQRLQDLESRLQTQVRGQDEAIQSVARVIKRARVGLSDPNRPLGIFLFAGPTGVGKTELALALANALFDDEKTLFRLDMSEFMEKHQVSRLTGSPPGYVGYEEEGQLTGRLRRHPYSVILFDEIEKAHRDVQNLFLQLFDAGRITDARGNFADGRNAIFILTTNLGAKESLNSPDRESYERHMQAAVENYFSPEFISRISRVVYFNPLTEDLMLAIFDKFFAQAVERFRAQNIEVEITDAFKREICKKYSDVKRGARPLLRGIDEEIIAPLTDRIISGEVKAGMKVTLRATGELN